MGRERQHGCTQYRLHIKGASPDELDLCTLSYLQVSQLCTHNLAIPCNTLTPLQWLLPLDQPVWERCWQASLPLCPPQLF